jgi:molybdenum cofactor sulfurtransferase
LNEVIKAQGGKAASAAVFRANIVLAERPASIRDREQPWTEDSWTHMSVHNPEAPVAAEGVSFDLLGGCRRCQMLCIDQQTSEKNAEPFLTLAKIRRIHGKVLFGVHTALRAASALCNRRITISSGDVVMPSL